ncbi:MAG TPA: DUF2442 domain-containing protein [Lacipirellula sp.]
MRITTAKPLRNYHVELTFDSGETGVVDLSSLAGRGVFAVWNQSGLFEQVSVTDVGALQWPGEIDLCPDALYLQMTGKKPEDIFPALKPSVCQKFAIVRHRASS